MKLYDTPLAPNPRRVRWFMAEKAIDDIEVITLNLTSCFYVLRATVALWNRQSCPGSIVFCSSAAASVAGRMVYRFLPPSASRITIIVVPLIVIGVAASTLSSNFGLLALLSAYAAVDAASGLLYFLALRQRLMAVLCGLLTLGLAVIWVRSLYV